MRGSGCGVRNDKNSQQRPNLSVCLIVKNEEKWIKQCLESIKPVADEIIVVDTGSSDKSCEIAQSFGARIFYYIWQDDFSDARNFSSQQASGNWILSLDADEIIAEKDYAELRQLTETPASRPTAYQILTRNYINRNDIVGWRPNDKTYNEAEQGCGWIPSLKTRLWSNDQRIRFSFPVHEVVSESLKKLKIVPQPCSITIHHYGKLNQLQADAKGERYYLLGLKKLDEMDGAITPLRELAVQAGILGRHKEAAELWLKLLQLQPDNAEAYLNLGSALFFSGRVKEALKAAEKSSQIDQNLKESHFNRALYELHLGWAAAAEKRLRKLLRKSPEYNAAKFMHAAAQCCKNGSQAGRKAFTEITNKEITAEMLAIAGSELAETLIKAGRNNDAEKIKKAT